MLFEDWNSTLAPVNKRAAPMQFEAAGRIAAQPFGPMITVQNVTPYAAKVRSALMDGLSIAVPGPRDKNFTR